MKFLSSLMLAVACWLLPAATNCQTILINESFTTNNLPAGVTSDGIIFPTKAADGVCTIGMIQVNSGGYLQVNTTSCGVFRVNMKSTSSATRFLTIKYKKDGETAYSVVSTTLAVSTAAAFDLTTLFPALVSTVPVSVRIEPTNGNIQVHDLYVESSAGLSNAAEITSFKIPGQTGVESINSITGIIDINVPLGINLVGLIPVVALSSQATINPLAGMPQNFTSEVVYTVTAQDAITIKSWKIHVAQVASAAKEITAFKLSNSQLGNAVLNSAAGTIAVTMPIGSTLNSLVPVTLAVSALASVSPSATTALNFAQPVMYTVTAQDNSTKAWTVNVTLADPNAVYMDYEAEQAQFTGTVANNHAGFSGTGFIDFLTSGENAITFNVCEVQAGSQTAKFRYSIAKDDVRTGKLFVNDLFVQLLAFPRTPTFTDWVDETATVSLNAGVNRITITWDSTDGPNLDKLMLTGAACNSYTLAVTKTNGGTVSITPARTGNRYFEGETVTLLANNLPALHFDNWTGDLTGNTNPAMVTMNANKNITANFSVIPTFELNVVVNGIGQVLLSPAGGEYAANTLVTLTAIPVLGSVFTGWGGDLSGTNPVATIAMTGIRNVTATFSSNLTFNFEAVTGFAAVSGDGFTGPTRGGQCAPDTVVINGPAEFNKLCETLYNRQQAYRTNLTVAGIKKAPLVILLKAGIYDGTQTLSVNGAKVFGNSMLDIPEQGDLSFVGQSGVVFKIGINVKRSYNLLIRNIFFQDYYDDGINIGGSETHHIWVDHCTLGHPTSLPADSEHPDGGCDIKDGASYVTVSWCVFRNSWKTSLIGHSDNNGGTDVGRLKVTFVNNHFLGTNSRNPRVRFGEVHVLNNLAENVHLYGIAAANGAWIYAENNFYLNTDWPMVADRSAPDFKAVYGNNTDGVYTSKTGNYPALGLKQVGNAYDDSGLPLITAQINPAMLNPGGRSLKFDELNAAAVFNPANYYSYTPLAASDVRVIVPLFAGADKVTFTAPCTILPLKLLSFTASLQQGANTGEVHTSWQTTNEINSRNFLVEKSSNGRGFRQIGSVNANNMTGTNNYQWIDKNVLPGLSYYRLKQVDLDGKYGYSAVVVVNNSKRATLAVFPNPATSQVAVTHPATPAKSFLQILSAEGKLLMQVTVVPATTVTLVNISTLGAGNYRIVLQNEKRAGISFIKL